MVKVLIGDIFKSEAKTLVNTVNCVGVMGKGIALEFKKRYPKMFEEYETLCSMGKVKPGLPYYYYDFSGVSVLNFPTKDNWRSPSKLSYITSGLKWFVEHYAECGIQSIAFPPLGCGNGGLTWDVVGPVMAKMLHGLPIHIEIYAPYGTPVEQLDLEYLLAQNTNESDEVLGKRLGTINKSWLMILETVHRVNSGVYTLHVGRVIFQKVCYVLTRSGIKTGFSFTKGSYGPYSPEVKNAITLLSNANLMIERQAYGKGMVETVVTPLFKFDPEQYTKDEIEVMESTVDLFSRINNTEQAEMIATVLYSYDQLIARGGTVSDTDICEYVLDWKKKWSDVKQGNVMSTISDLAMLGWIHPRTDMSMDEI